ncbi:leucine-rich repeat receptor protein kinase HPCA1-like isoform X2 [Nicotiana tomentosiformis]|uniref:leucine-rich repeat receptor protein kinase HPCA1-like isoform X2 n=1 Tax=Nicotiana tomentosiformis TaxID=4098 RepID=UPI00051B630A|nr:probable leucine-rich repeat receptor-like protein kinase At5g49770 isoform X2 [Nicotiana tomentosiformis]XP_016473457.1 PREDICTED: probable leucine-rich repeat receptor-like protein kinase At5g49770 isoform X2 [Nicotiana tabacum]
MVQTRRIQLISWLLIFMQVLGLDALTNSGDYGVLESLREEWENVPPNWSGTDPCGDPWDGIECNNSRVVTIKLSSMNLKGELSGDIEALSELQILDLSYNKDLTGSLPQSIGSLKSLSILILVGCRFSGLIPDTVGSLSQLVFLSLNLNNFVGPIPASIGNLSKLYWLDLADNRLSGPLPVSHGSTPGLDMLVHTKHFHLGRNQLSGEIPAQLFSSNMTLKHLLLENNQLTGKIPPTLGLVKTLEVVRLDRNSLDGSIPSTLNNLMRMSALFLSNNEFTGPLPDLTGMNALNYLDMSNNTFSSADFPLWFSSLQSLTTLVMENTQLEGEIPATLFNLFQLQTVILRGNKINGTLDIASNYGSQLKLIDLQNNYIDSFTERPGYRFQLILMHNPVCQEGGSENYCGNPQENFGYSTLQDNCFRTQCSSDQIPSPTCKCAYPYTGDLYFRAPSFSDLTNTSIYVSLQQSMISSFSQHQVLVDSVSLSNPKKNSDDYLVLHLQVFPFGQDRFNRTGITTIGFELSNQTFKPPPNFGPFFFIGESYNHFEVGSRGSHKSIAKVIIIGAAAGGVILLVLSLIIGVYACQKKRATETARKSDPFATWDSNKDSGAVPQLKGVKSFSFEELKKYTNNFSEINYIGSGSYGKVYRGTLPDRQLIAIKRAEQGSKQGALEFKTEIEILSRFHHKNVVSLLGFCFGQGEQMLVYEYIPNGSLKESLSGKSGIKLDWKRRLRIALGAARGLQYLHDHVYPPIIHRDIKSNNILLDEHLNAKVADFGLSKSMSEPEKGYVSTQVKGTMGYMDPEYYTSQQLTEKSDVYSFGVVLLELITARSPIVRGKYIVKEVKQAIDKSKDMYNIDGFVDPTIPSSMTPISFRKFVDLALRCVEEAGVHRPTMYEVVKEIENIMEMDGMNTYAESGSTSASCEGTSIACGHPYSEESLVSYSGGTNSQ